MSVPNQTPYIIYNANGLTTVFPFEFYVINAGDIQVTVDGTVVTSGYSVSGVGNVGGGDVVFVTPPASGAVVMLERVVPTYRLTDYQDNGDLLADTVNKDFDRLWMAIQRSFIYLGLALRRPLLGGPYDAQGYRIEKGADPVNLQDFATKNYVDNVSLVRALRVPESQVSVLPPASQRANQLLAFNASGQPITVLPPSGSASDVLIELAKPTGAGLIGMPQGGTLAQNLVTVSVDAFGADPTGATDSSPAVIAALQSVYGTTLDSKYYASRTKYAQILFGNGTYMLGDIPLIGGTDYVGQGRWATRIIPKAGASYIFKTVGTLPAGDGGGGARYFNGSIREMLLGDRYLSTGLAANVGGINIMNGSYFRLYNVDVLRLSGPGVWFDGLWDSQFFGLRIMYCGQSASSPGLHIGYTTTSGGVKEGSNGLQFYGLHIELCAQLLAFDYVAHVLISGCKLEGGPDSVISSRIDSPVEVCFADAQLTWQKIAYPMFNMVPGTGMDQPTGVHFSSPRLVGNAATPSWFFNYSSTVAPLLISNITARSVTKLITGANFIIDGGVTYNCGPTIANGVNGTRIIDLVCRQVPAVTTSADNTFILTGTESEVSGCYIQCAGSNSDGAACVQIASGATDAKVFNNVFTGAKQYGILQNGTVISRYIRDNVLGPSANITALMTGSTPLLSSNLISTPVTIAASASGTVAVIGRACVFSISATLGSTTASCIVHSDSTGT
ncbi:TPA: hypothetical protein QCJ95_004985, partial [Enterobacter asburiae]|nr:hypothetical protein [Enterobacter asburiae]HDR2801752.1 hypothetical protein [Enterobacter asburiae]